jgi:hypothetical protein
VRRHIRRLRGLQFGLLMGVFVACIHPISNFVTMNMDTKLGLEIAASNAIGWVLAGLVIGLVYKPQRLNVLSPHPVKMSSSLTLEISLNNKTTSSTEVHCACNLYRDITARNKLKGRRKPAISLPVSFQRGPDTCGI